VDLEEDHYAQFNACTPQQTGGSRRTSQDAHKLATLGLYPSEVDLVLDGIANFKLFGAAVTQLKCG
jgi:hypothetical protein